MGLIYYGVCQDCKEFIDLDKFYSFAAYKDETYADLSAANLENYCNEGFVFRAIRLQMFLDRHRGDRVGVYTEHETDCWRDDDFKEVMKWPSEPNDYAETIHFDDPHAGRLIIKTKYGEVFLDVLKEGINIFTFGWPDELMSRKDFLVLPNRNLKD